MLLGSFVHKAVCELLGVAKRITREANPKTVNDSLPLGGVNDRMLVSARVRSQNKIGRRVSIENTLMLIGIQYCCLM